MSMLVVSQKKDEYVCRAGDLLRDINIVLKGSVIMRSGENEVLLETGAVIGLMECTTRNFTCDYIAAEDILVASYAFDSHEDFDKIFTEQPQYSVAFLHAALVHCEKILNFYRQLETQANDLYIMTMNQYQEYGLECQKLGLEPDIFPEAENIGAPELAETIRQWELDYVEALGSQSSDAMKKFYGDRHKLSAGELIRLSRLMNIAVDNLAPLQEYIDSKKKIIFDSSENDIVNLWFTLARRAVCLGEDNEYILEKLDDIKQYLIEMHYFPFMEVAQRFMKIRNFDYETYAKEHAAEEQRKADKAYVDVKEYLNYLLNYAGYEEEKKAEIRQLLTYFGKIAGVESTDKKVVAVRGRTNEFFFDMYRRIFFRLMEKKDSPSTMLLLFLRFGLVDPALVEEEQINELVKMNSILDEGGYPNVYTFYDWIKCIADGEKDPSKNEFDLDYSASLREMRKANKITADEEKILQKDVRKKVEFELENLFKSASKGTFGRAGAYSPVLTKQVLTLPVERMFSSPEKIMGAVEGIKAIDFRCFYREVMFFDPLHDESSRMNIQKEILPDIILMPNCGQRGMMWQESETFGRDTAARFLFPIFSVTNLDDLMIDVIGRYRWEICRKLQGMRWNDITEPSLTSEFYDFFEFYKKNRNLSADGREKIKTVLARVKGSYRDAFVLDYINWIKFESKGSFRLNKVSREIMAKYCPFPSEIRFKLIDNPMFKNSFSKYENIMLQQETKLKNNLKRYKNDGGEISQELVDALHFYRR